MAIRLLSVLSLDRLADFIFDHVVAPVRETASQTLAALMRVMPAPSIRATHRCLIGMILQSHLASGPQDNQVKGTDGSVVDRRVPGYSWEVRHAGLLGLKYELALQCPSDPTTSKGSDATSSSSETGTGGKHAELPSHPKIIKADPDIAVYDDDVLESNNKEDKSESQVWTYANLVATLPEIVQMVQLGYRSPLPS